MRTPPAARLAIMLVPAVALLAAGCGTSLAPTSSNISEPPSSPPATSPAAASSAPVTSTPAASQAPASPPAGGVLSSGACQASAITISLDTAAAGAAAGSSYVPLEFTNSSASACTLPGYPVVAFASGLTGPQIGAQAALEQQSAARPLVLRPGERAHAWLAIADAANFPAGTCKPATAQGLRIGLRSGQAARFISKAFAVCTASVRGATLAVYPVRAGRAARGSAP